MALPYATEEQLKRVKKELEKKINAGGGASGEIPTKLSQLTNDAGFITTAALTDYALKSELPDLSSYALKTEIPEVDGFATKEEVTEAVKDTVKYQSFQNPNDPAPRKTIQLANHDTLSGIGTNGQGYNIAMVSKWDKVDLGAAGLSINLNGKDARPTYNDDKELALKEDIPDITPLATKEEVEKIAVKEEGAAIQVGDDNHELNIKTNGRFTVNSAHEVVTYDPYPGDSTRKILPLENNDSISGKKTTGDGVPLIFVSKWDKVEVGGNGAPLNLNGSADRVTYKDDKEFAFVDDLEWIPVICNMNFRTLSDKVYTQDEIFAWFFVKDIFELKDTIIKHPIYLRYGISLSTNPMYYYIPCQYVAFTDANTVEMITDGLDTKNDKFSRYHITIKLDGTVINGASNIKVELKENVFVPDLPEDADTKTYTLKAVNGKFSWVE